MSGEIKKTDASKTASRKGPSKLALPGTRFSDIPIGGTLIDMHGGVYDLLRKKTGSLAKSLRNQGGYFYPPSYVVKTKKELMDAEVRRRIGRNE